MFWVQLITNLFYLGVGGFVMFQLYTSMTSGGITMLVDRDWVLFGLICFMTLALTATITTVVWAIRRLSNGEG